MSKAEAATIRTVFEPEGELSASMKLRRSFPGIADGVKAREMARVIACEPVYAHLSSAQRRREGPRKVVD